MRKKRNEAINSDFPFKNNEQLALYYCREAGVENFKDLKNTIYWGYYLEDSKRFHKKIISETKIIPSTKDMEVITCKKCGTPFGSIIGNFVLLNLKYSFQSHKAPLKILCECGEPNIFEDLINKKIGETNDDKN